MPNSHPTRQRGVDPTKVQRAREMRRDMTDEERILWGELRLMRHNGYAFRRQQIIAGFIVDFYCHRAGLVVEVDGPIHDQQRDYDRERDARIADYGLRILRISNDDVRHRLKDILSRIDALLAPADSHSSPSSDDTD
jgi:very-short-patch-repair endonuclease